MKLSTDKFLTIEEVAKILRVSTRSVNRYIVSGKLKASKIGWWRIKQSDLDEFLEETSNIKKEHKK
jgi:excisionase family DNA binding protein